MKQYFILGGMFGIGCAAIIYQAHLIHERTIQEMEEMRIKNVIVRNKEINDYFNSKSWVQIGKN